MYNVEEYIEKCIRSLEEQDIPKDDYEIICINDGSPDHSKQIVFDLQMEYSNIILIDQVNQGVSKARNNGITISRGTYIVFVDPDDYVHPNYLRSIIDKVLEKNVEVAFLGFILINQLGFRVSEVFNNQFVNKVYSGIESYHISRGDGKVDPDRIWAVVFERDFIIKNELFFLPGMPFLEDGELIARILCLAKRTIFLDYPFYFRTIRDGSATNSNLFYSQAARDGFILAALNLKKFRHLNKLTIKQMNFLNQPICKFTCLPLLSSLKDFHECRRTIKTLSDAGLLKCSLKDCNNFYKIEGFLFNLSPYLFIFHRIIGKPLLKLVKP